MIVEDVAQSAATRRRRRRMMPLSFIIAGIAIAAAVAYLIIANTGQSAEYYMTISQLRTCSSCSSQTVRVAGYVAPNSIVRSDSTSLVRFSMTEQTNAGAVLPVQYSGVVPDIFKVGAQVVVEGHVVNGVFHAQTLLTKCPSKFQSATPGATSSSAGGN